MLVPSASTRVYVCTHATDMRKSFDGLIAMTKHVIEQDPLSGHWFVFVNRNRNYLKLLCYAQGGYCLWCKRLEQGRFSILPGTGNSVSLSATQLMMWIDGIALEQRSQAKRYPVSPSSVTRV